MIVLFAWHTDEGEQIPCAGSREYVSFWIPLDDIEENSGGLEVCPKQASSQLDTSRTTGALSIRAGDAVVFSSKVWHASGPNVSDNLRRVYYIQVYFISACFIVYNIKLFLLVLILKTVQSRTNPWTIFLFTSLFGHTHP